MLISEFLESVESLATEIKAGENRKLWTNYARA